MATFHFREVLFNASGQIEVRGEFRDIVSADDTRFMVIKYSLLPYEGNSLSPLNAHFNGLYTEAAKYAVVTGTPGSTPQNVQHALVLPLWSDASRPDGNRIEALKDAVRAGRVTRVQIRASLFQLGFYRDGTHYHADIIQLFR